MVYPVLPNPNHTRAVSSSPVSLLLLGPAQPTLPGCVSSCGLHVYQPLLQVPGCLADLSSESKRYCWLKRICSKHMQVRMVRFGSFCVNNSQPGQQQQAEHENLNRLTSMTVTNLP
jgi:hypothetical protein